MPTRHSGCSHPSRWLGAACGLALALQAAPLHAETGMRLVYDWTQTSAAGAGSPETTTSGRFTARLGETALAIRHDDEETVYDFAARRVVLLDHARRQRREISLYVSVASRDAEIVNRRFVAETMALLTRKRGDLADEECDLGLLASPPAKAKLREQRRGNARVFRLNGRESASFVAADAALSAPLAPGLRRLLVYEARLHPLVTSALSRDPRIPQQLAFRWEPVTGRSAVSWELREAAADTVDPATWVPDYALVPIEAGGVAEIAFRVRTGQAGAAPSAESYQARAERLIGEGRGFEALLVAIEQQFAGGEAPGGLLRRARDASAGDARARAVLAVIDLGQRDPKAALELLAGVNAQGLEGAHVLAILRANQRLTLQQSDAAQEEFARALAVNPFLIGPLLDAGRIYTRNYQAAAGRECWDAVRAIAPRHPLLKEIDARDEALRREYPQFF